MRSRWRVRRYSRLPVSITASCVKCCRAGTAAVLEHLRPRGTHFPTHFQAIFLAHPHVTSSDRSTTCLPESSRKRRPWMPLAVVQRLSGKQRWGSVSMLQLHHRNRQSHFKPPAPFHTCALVSVFQPRLLHLVSSLPASASPVHARSASLLSSRPPFVRHSRPVIMTSADTHPS